MRFIRKFVLWVLGLAIVVVGVAVGAFYLIPSDTLKGWVAASVKDATGRDLVIEGDLERSLFPTLSFKTGPVRLSNAPWASQDDFFSADAAEVGVDTWSLIAGPRRVTVARIENPVLNLEVNAEGVGNWEMGAADGDGDADRGGRGGDFDPIIVDDAAIVNGLLRYEDPAGGQSLTAEAVDLTLSLPSYDKTLELEGTATINGRATNITGRLDNVAKALAGDTAQLVLELAGDGVEMTFNGELALDGAGPSPIQGGEFRLAMAGDRNETAWVRDALPSGFDRVGSIMLEGEMDMRSSALAVDMRGEVELGASALTMTATAKGGAGWMVGEDPVEVAMTAANPAQNFSFMFNFEGDTRFDDDGLLTALAGLVTVRGENVPDALADMQDMLADLGLAIDPETLFFSDLSLDARVDYARLVDVDADRLLIDEVALLLDSARVSGELSLDPARGATPGRLSVLSEDVIDLRPLSERGATGGGADDPGAAATGWSEEAIDLAGLDIPATELTIDLGGLVTSGAPLGRTEISGLVGDGELALQLTRVEVYDGVLTGEVRAEASPPTYSLDLDFAALSLAAITADAPTPVIGRADVKLAVAGGLASELDAMRSMNGALEVTLIDGRIVGVDLASMVRNLCEVGSEGTEFDTVEAQFDIVDGVANGPMTFQGPLLRAQGAGDVFLAPAGVTAAPPTLDYLVTPKAVASIEGQGGSAVAPGVAVPIRLTGSMSDPEFEPQWDDVETDLEQIGGAVGNIGQGAAECFTGGGGTPLDGVLGGLEGVGDVIEGVGGGGGLRLPGLGGGDEGGGGLRLPGLGD